MAEFDPVAYLDTVTDEPVQPVTPDLPEVKPKKLTFYYPETPEATQAAGLSYSTEGGISGGPGFGDLDLRKHTLEKFHAGESPFVAVAMPGTPTGEEFRMTVEGKPIIAKNVDTGGGLHGSHIDIATSNPDLARGGGYGMRGSAGVEAGAGRQVRPIELPDIFAKQEEKKKSRGGRGISFAPIPVPKFEVKIPQIQQPFAIPEGGLNQDIAGIGEPIPSTDFSRAVQEAVMQPPPASLLAGPPTAGSIQQATQEFDPAAYLASPLASPVATRTPAPSPAPSQTPAPEFDPATYLSTSSTVQSQELPQPPVISEEPSVVQKLGRAVVNYGKEMIPESLTGAVATTGTPTSLDPEQIANFVIPQLRPLTTTVHQIARRTKQVREAEKTPPLSQERFDAGVAVTLDMLNTAGAAKGGQALARRSFAKPALPAVTETGVRGSGAFRRSYRLDKEIGQQMDMIGSAREFGAYKAEIASRNLLSELSKAQEAELGQYLVSRRLKTVNPNHPQILPESEMTRIESDPAIAKALDYYKKEIKPDIEQWRKKAGLTEEAAAGKEPEFISLIPVTDEVLPPKPGITSARRLSRTTSFAKPAEGFAKEYNTDVKQVLERSYSEVIRKARVREFYDMAEEKGLTEVAPVRQPEGRLALDVIREEVDQIPTADVISEAKQIGGGKEIRERVNEWRKNRTLKRESTSEEIGYKTETFAREIVAQDRFNRQNALPTVPRGKIVRYEDLHPDLQRDLTAATVRPPMPVGLEKVGPLIQRTITGAALTANPAELSNHMRRQLNIVAAKPPIGFGVLARLEALAPYFGPKIGTLKRAIMQDMNLPENQAILSDIFESGGGSTRSFEQMYQSKIPGLKWLQHKTTKLLFGVPKGRGLNGYDLRMRVLLEKIRRAEEGIDPERTRKFSTGIGEYGSHTSWIVKGLRKFNPYAATTLPLRGSELKQMVGISGLRSKNIGMASLRQGETFLRGTGGTLAMLVLANHQLSGKWPWENDAGHEFDLNTGVKNKDGKTIYVTLRAIAPELYRPISTISIPNLLRERTAKHPQYASAAAVGPTNQVASLLAGPAQNLALTAATGKVPYFLKRPGEGPELMDIAMLKKGEAAAGKSRFVRQLFAAIGGVNPALARIFGSQFHVEVPENMAYMQEPIYGVKPFGEIYSTAYEKKKGKGKPIYIGR